MAIAVPVHVKNSLAARYGVKEEMLAFFAGGGSENDGTIYSFPAGEAVHLLKIMGIPKEEPLAQNRIQERLSYVRYMGDRGIQIVYPLPSIGGQLMEVDEDGDGKRFAAYVMEKKPGCLMADVKAEERKTAFAEWGRTVGRLHAAAKTYPHWQCLPGEEDLESQECLLDWEWEWKGFYQWLKDEDVKKEWVTVRDRLRGLPKDRDSFGFIHNDPHAYNLLYHEGQATLLDFDVAVFHWFMTDVAIMVFGAVSLLNGWFSKELSQEDDELIRLLLDSYNKENPLTPEWLERLELFLEYRRILLFTVFYDQFQSQPEGLNTWKQGILARTPVWRYN
jgi:amicoumacin kinase